MASSSVALTPSEISTKLASLAGVIMMVTDSRPSVRDADSCFFALRSTLAMSSSCTGEAPSAAGTITSFAKSSTFSNALPTVISSVEFPSEVSPPGSTTPALSSASVMSCWLTWCLPIASSSRESATISSGAPSTVACATPGTWPRSLSVLASSRRASSAMSRSEETATIMAGISPLPPDSTCVVVPSGKSSLIRLSSTSVCAAAR